MVVAGHRRQPCLHGVVEERRLADPGVDRLRRAAGPGSADHLGVRRSCRKLLGEGCGRCRLLPHRGPAEHRPWTGTRDHGPGDLQLRTARAPGASRRIPRHRAHAGATVRHGRDEFDPTGRTPARRSPPPRGVQLPTGTDGATGSTSEGTAARGRRREVYVAPAQHASDWAAPRWRSPTRPRPYGPSPEATADPAFYDVTTLDPARSAPPSPATCCAPSRSSSTGPLVGAIGLADPLPVDRRRRRSRGGQRHDPGARRCAARRGPARGRLGPRHHRDRGPVRAERHRQPLLRRLRRRRAAACSTRATSSPPPTTTGSAPPACTPTTAARSWRAPPSTRSPPPTDSTACRTAEPAVGDRRSLRGRPRLARPRRALLRGTGGPRLPRLGRRCSDTPAGRRSPR